MTEITNEAVKAAEEAWHRYAADASNDPGFKWHLRAAIEAALPHLDVDGAILTTVRQCRICGCTDEEACPGGCSWAQPEICSTCALRQQIADEQYLATLRAQQHASELQAKGADAQLEFIAEGRALIAEQGEVAQMQREHFAGETWRRAVDCAARDAGSPTQTDGANHRIQDDAQWFAHLLGNPPVVF